MIKFIFTTLVIIFLIRLVAPFLFRWLLGMFVKKSMRNGTFFYGNINNQQQRQQEQNSQRAGNGNVKIDYIPDQSKNKGFDGGEYVDYEEVK
ncbi:DUF4834 family protein [Pontibacter sp. SGAir0037]|uniref:DUF4834 family protein n=1 Tax=Pontibacter sp. SGAir0037 TaxID=2571030 RepID=UPI0010CD131A|nr:DUF4834 family protein [Pontibacter sp. SGAir0037]QCR24271.1 DUF4834 domain-containing protein [Pontibacter sp. SGAir0037]